ncbi:MAG: hypothetical protein QGF90_16250 [Gammaproteobacteria bacterium]|jgi:hypothetical protein|nr:hypothetical protein [Gammaproteobacteria bacterium]|tara:strand:- start:35 stop:508 length:474 start_codon:yes stop_codon:yes gene_type:complete
MNLSAQSLFLVGVLVINSNLAVAQNETPAENTIVIEDLSRSELNAEIEKVENEFYRVFNAAIEDEFLKVTCSWRAPTGTRIEQRVCEPKFMVDRRNENVRDWQNETDTLMSREELSDLLQPEFEELAAAINVVMEENQYFRELYDVLTMLRGRLQEL